MSQQQASQQAARQTTKQVPKQATGLTRAQLGALRVELERVLGPIGQRNGLTITVGGGSFDANNASFRLEVAEVRPDGTVMTKERSDFPRYASYFGLLPTDLDRVFVSSGVAYRIVGIVCRARDYPVLVERLDRPGKRLRMNHRGIGQILRAIDRESAEVSVEVSVEVSAEVSAAT